MDEKIVISVVIPCFNEEDNIFSLWHELCPVLESLDTSWEVIFVDDCSSDSTAQKIRDLDRNEVILLSHSVNQGESAAQLTGFRSSRGTLIVTMDADLQNDPRDLPYLIDSLKGYGAVCGIRPSRADSLSKKISTKIANLFRNTILRDGIKDAGCTYRVFKKEVLVDIVPFRGMHRFLPTILQFHGIKINQVFIKDRPRKSGVSKYGMGNRIFVGFVDTLAIYWYKKRFVSPFKK
tara:strand:+ start:312 stop:1016 length:705 start_codon:yes stop_codon:yes gene_type:complete